MSQPELFTLGSIIVGLLLVAMTLGGSFLVRLPLSAAMLYLALGVAVGPMGWGLFRLDALENSVVLERATEIALLISLFNSGMKLELPLRHARWRIPVQLATVSMLLTVGAVSVVGVYLLNLPLGAAVLLGAILAPTDPVLASDVQVVNPADRDRLRFGLTGEGGLNDGTAFPMVMLGLGLLGLHGLDFDNGSGTWRWWAVDVLWSSAGGLGLGYALGSVVGRLIIYLRMRYHQALDSDEFIAFGLIALTYGLALLVLTNGFLAVFAAGLALSRVNESPYALPPVGAGDADDAGNLSPSQLRATGHGAPAHMMYAVVRFNGKLERFAEIAIVLVLGVLLASAEFKPAVLWFVPLLFLVIRPLAVWAGLFGTLVSGQQRCLISWFGIRGIGSLYYMVYAINNGLAPALANDLLSITLGVVVASIVAHGVSVTPLMRRYEKQQQSDT